MGNTASKTLSESGPRQYLGHVRLPTEIQLAIASHLCPSCSVGEDAIMATEDARKRQCDLGALAAACKNLHIVANEHRFHSFVMPYNPDYMMNLTMGSFEDDFFLADRYHIKALPELLERLITYGQLSESLQYLSIRNATMTYKAGVTKRRLRLFISASETHGLEVPDIIPRLLECPECQRDAGPTVIEGDAFWLDGELWMIDFHMEMSKAFNAWMIHLLLFCLAPRLKKLLIDPEIAEDVFDLDYLPGIGLPSVMTVVIPRAVGFSRIILPSTDFRTENLLLRFPNLRTCQNHDSGLTAYPVVHRFPGQSPPLFSTVRRLLLAGDQPGRLEHVTAILHDFPQLEELHYHRLKGMLEDGDPDFCNADVFNGVHRCLRKLTYSSTQVEQQPFPDPINYGIEIHCYEESRFSDVPHFGGFAVLEELTIDQALLGRMSTIRDRVESPTGPYYPELAWKLPQSLRCLTIHFVYDWAQLASQFISIAMAKNGGQLPLLTDIYIVLVRAGTVTYDYAWSPHIPLLPRESLTRTTGEMLKQASIDLWTRSAAIGPPPGELEDYPRDPVPPGKPIKFYVIRTPFRHL